MSYGIDARNIRRDRFARSKFAQHLRLIRDLTFSTLICYALVFGGVALIQNILGR
jgi:hypothetical protein